MRLVAWNVNHNNRRRTFREAIALLEPLFADVLVLSEIAPPIDEDPRRVQWLGSAAPGLAVVVREGLELVAHPANVGAPRLVGGFAIRGAIEFHLVAAWPVQAKGDPSYHKVLMGMLERFGESLSSGRAILAGDLNTSSKVQTQEVTHPEFVNGTKSLGLVSAYHEQTGEGHGKETVATYLHSANDIGRFHIDYCFVPKPLAAATNISVMSVGEWPQRSDHFPLVVDIPDRAFSQTLTQYPAK